MSHAPLTAGIEDWLLASALEDPPTHDLFAELCQRLRAIGLPIDRVMLTWVILHPLFGAEELLWREGEGVVELVQREHASIGSPIWLASPLAHVHSNRIETFRRRLEGEAILLDFGVLEQFRDEGFTDYLITSARFRVGDMSGLLGGEPGMLASWATRRPGGFSQADLEALERIRKPLAVATHASIQRRVLENVATTYLGATAGAGVLTGDIRLGDGALIPGVLWFSDLRGSTRLAESMERDDYLALLNAYYACTAGPVIEAGGEILTFIGDGVLAGFPIEGDDPHAAVVRAEAAVAGACRRRAEALAAGTPGGAPLDFGIGLSIGEVTVGNIGVPDRLAFTAIGPAANRAQRIEAATKTLGHPVLAEAAVAEAGQSAWQPAGEARLNSLATPTALYTPAALL